MSEKIATEAIEGLLSAIEDARSEYSSVQDFAVGANYGALPRLERIWKKARTLGLSISRYPDFDTQAMFIAGIKGGASGQSVPEVSAKAFEDFHEALVFAGRICRERISVPAVSEDRVASDPDSSLAIGDAETSQVSKAATGLDSLTPALKRAWASWKLAESQFAKKPLDQKAYDWLNEQPDETFFGELAGYELPTFATWSSYVQKGRTATGERKNQPRAGRATGGSVVKQSEI